MLIRVSVDALGTGDALGELDGAALGDVDGGQGLEVRRHGTHFRSTPPPVGHEVTRS